MKKSISRVLGLVLTMALLMGCFSVGMTAAALEGELSVEASMIDVTLSIGNEFLQRNFTFAGGKVATASIVNKRSGVTLIPGAGSEDFIISVTNQFETNVDATVRERQIRTSDLILAGTPAVTDLGNGTQVVFTFQPIERFGIPWTIAYIVEMMDGDHYMNSWLEISVPEADRANAYLHTIDVDAFNIGKNIPDANLWCRKDPKTDKIYNQFISGFQQSSGQPLYVNSLFFGVEFQITSNDILPYPKAENAGQDKSLLMRYYSGKNFGQFADEGRLVNGAFRSWPAVVGAARSADYQVIQDDFYQYINAISQGTYFRTQFNTWYDGGMNITPASLTTSYMNIEQGLTQAGLPPISAYICDDGYNDYSAPFWDFKPSFANNVLKDISQMMTDAGGAFAKWISPRGGYGQTQSPFMAAAGTGYRSVSAYTDNGPGNAPTVAYRTEICASAPIYLENLKEMFFFNMDEYNVNYWKLDGMARAICRDPRHGHMVGGIVAGSANRNNGDTTAEQNDSDASSMWTFTELWENYNALFLAMREHQAENGKGLWLNSTGTSVPSPWYLKIVNSIKVITSPDSGKTGPDTFADGTTPVGDGARRLTFRDMGYWRFFNYNQYQFPFHYIWNHDPIYSTNSSYVEMTPEDLRQNLYGNAMRGTRVWELLFSPANFTEAHWLITNETINFARENMEILGNVRMITDERFNGGAMGRAADDQNHSSSNRNDTYLTPYMMSAWGEKAGSGVQEGIVSFRNNTTTKGDITLSLTLDKLAGVPEDIGDMYVTYVLPSAVNSGQLQNRKATYRYGDTVEVTLAPMEFVILHFSEANDTAAPAIVRTEVLDANTLRVALSEAIELTGGLPTVAGHTVIGAALTSDHRNVDITVSDAFIDNEAISLTGLAVIDLSGNAASASGNARFAEGRLISEFAATGDLTAGADVAYDDLLQSYVLTLDGNTAGFAGGTSADQTNRLSVTALIQTVDTDAVILEQADAYSIKINASGKVEFTVGGLTVESKQAVNDGNWHHFACIKEPNEMIKIYIDGKISASKYVDLTLNILNAGAVVIGSGDFTGKLSQLQVYNKSLGWMEVGQIASQPLATYDLAGYNAFTVEGLEPSLPATVQARYDTTGYYTRMGSVPGISATARFEEVKYFRNYDASWDAVDAADYAGVGKVVISGTLPGFDGDRAVSGTLSVIDEWQAGSALKGTGSVMSFVDAMEQDGWEIIGRNDGRLAVANNGLTITASRNKFDRGNIDAFDPEGKRILDGSPNPNYRADADPNDIDYINASKQNLDNVQNENIFVIDPGVEDYTITISGTIPVDQLNKSAGLIIRQDDDNFVRMTYRVSGCTGNGTRAAMSLNMHVGGEELTLEESPTARIGSSNIVDLAIEKKGNYYTGYYRTQDTNGAWIKVGTVKAEMDSPKAGFYAALGVQSLPEYGFSTTAFAPRFSDFTIRQYSVGLTIDPATAGALEVTTGDPAPRYAWANTTFSDGSRGSLLIELPAIDTSLPGEQTVQGTVAGGTTTVPMTVTMVGDPTPQYTITFEANGGTDVEPITKAENGTIDEAPVTTRAKYEFEGWYTDEALTEKVIFPYTVTEDATLFAKWVRIPTKVIADIRGSATGSLEAPVEYIISLLGMEKVLNASITFEVDESMLEGKGFELLSSGFTALDLTDDHTGAIRWTNMGNGVWQGEILLMNFAADGFSSDVAVDIAKVIYTARKIGDATMKLTKLEVVGIDEHNQVVYLDSEIRTAEATTSIVKVYSIFDLNKDGVIDALDLGIVQRYYQSTMSSDNWDAAKACDFNNDGCVDIKDLIELFRQYAR